MKVGMTNKIDKHILLKTTKVLTQKHRHKQKEVQTKKHMHTHTHTNTKCFVITPIDIR